MGERRLEENIEQMKGLAEMLLPLTFPKVEFEEEKDILLLKQRNMTVDGYELIVCYSKADYGRFMLDSLQVQSALSPFLPFNVVCKLGRAFLGPDNLSYIEFFKNNKKVYCWTVKSRDGRPLPPDTKTKPGSYEGFAFSILQPGSVDLF